MQVNIAVEAKVIARTKERVQVKLTTKEHNTIDAIVKRHADDMQKAIQSYINITRT